MGVEGEFDTLGEDVGREGGGGPSVSDEEGEHVFPADVADEEEGDVRGVYSVDGLVFGLVVGEGGVFADGLGEGVERAWHD